MALRMPVVDIPISDEKFRKFVTLFEKFRGDLDKTPEAWSRFNRAQARAFGNESGVTGGGGSLHSLQRSERLWQNIAGASRSTLGSVFGIGRELLKWGTLIGGGLLGGSLFGIDRMAGGVASTRRSAMGLGMSYGQLRSFNVNMGQRLGDPAAFLSSINQAVSNPALQGPLYALGVNPNGSTQHVAISMLQAMRKLALATPRGILGTTEQSYGLGPFGGLEMMMRLKYMSNAEFGKMIASERGNVNALGLPKGTGNKWVDFMTQVERAGAEINKTFVVGLLPLAGPLTKLSRNFVNILQAALSKNGIVEKGITDIAGWISKFNAMVATKQFLNDVATVTSATGAIAHFLAGFEKHPVTTGAKLAGKAAFDAVIKGPFEGGEAIGRWLLAGASAPRGIRYNNPGNLKYAGQAHAARVLFGGGFATFRTPQEGLVALGRQLELYRDRGLDTVSKIISAYAPPGDHNDTAAYIKDVTRRMHTRANQELDLNRPDTLAALMNAIIRHENRNLNPYGRMVARAARIAIHDETGGAVGIIVHNKTGGNPVLTAAGLAGSVPR